MYKAVLAMGYFGLMRVGELVEAKGNHTIKLKDVHISSRNKKIVTVLHSSKTHARSQHL